MTMLPSRVPVWLAAGGVLGVAVALSPVAVLGLGVLGLIVIAGQHGLHGLERRVVVGIVLVSVAVRLLAILVLFLSADPGHIATFPFEGDAWLLKQRALWIRNLWLGTPIEPFFFTAAFDPYGWSGFVHVVAFLEYIFSPAPYAIHVINLCCSLAGVLGLYRLVRWGYGAAAGLIALAVLLLLPTQFLWSVSGLKEPLYGALLVAIVAVAALAGSKFGAWHRLAALAGVVVAAMAVDNVRAGALVIVALALVIAAAGTFMVRRPCVLIIVLLLGPAAALRALEVPAVHDRVMGQLRTRAVFHIGHVRTLGHSYRTLDQRFYTFEAGDPTNPFTMMTGEEAARFAARSLGSFWVVPTPGQVVSASEVVFLPQQLLWYALLLLAVVGLFAGSLRHPWLTWLLAGFMLSGALAIALNSGNVGTLVRHRDAIVPFVVCLSAIGAASLLERAGLFQRSVTAAAAELVAGGAVPPPSFASRVVAGSAAAQWSIRVCTGSAVCRAAASLLRPTIGYRTPAPDAGDAGDVLARVAGSSTVCALALRGAAPIAAAWRHAHAYAAVARLRARPLAERIRLTGRTVVVAVVVAGALAPFGDAAWPAVFPGLMALAAGITLLAAPHALAVGWQRRVRT